MNAKVEEINTFMLAQFTEQGFEDTTDNRIAFLEGLRDAWREDVPEPDEDLLGKALYMMALSGEIARLKMSLRWPKINT